MRTMIFVEIFNTRGKLTGEMVRRKKIWLFEISFAGVPAIIESEKSN